MNAKKKRFILLAIWMGLTFYLCQQNGTMSGNLSGGLASLFYAVVKVLPFSLDYDSFHLLLRKFAHFMMHFILAILAYRAIRAAWGKKLSFLEATSVCLGIACLAAIFDEAVQLFSAGRDARIYDMLINLSGAVTGTFLWRFLLYLHLRKAAR